MSEESSESNKVELIFRDEQSLQLLSKLLPVDRWKKKLILVLIPALTFFGGMLTIAASLYIDTKDRELQREIREFNFDVGQMESEIERKEEYLAFFNISVTNMRKVRLIVVEACRLGLRNTAEEKFKFYKERIEVRKDVLKVIFNIDPVFPNIPNFDKYVAQITYFDRSVKDVCARDSPKDEKWASIQKEISTRIKKSIELSNKKLASYKISESIISRGLKI